MNENKLNKLTNQLIDKLPFWARGLLLIVIIVGFILGALANIKTIKLEKVVPTDESIQKAEDEEITIQEINSSKEQNCHTNWILFDSSNWRYISRFKKIGDIFTLTSLNSEKDVVMYYINDCKGGIQAEVEFTPLTSFINLNLHYGSWFRWEIGGQDLNSVRLYVNSSNSCTALKKIQRVSLSKNYLKSGNLINTNQPVTVKFLIYLTELGLVRTEILLDYTSTKGELITNEGNFFHDFEVDLSCEINKNKIWNINNDYEQIGVGLAKTEETGEIPKVKLNKFRVLEKK